jgi:hypothetical protein
MMPEVTEPWRPSGLPTASTVSPICTESLSPNLAGVRPDTPSALTTARSVFGSVPTIFALADSPSEKITRTISPCALWATWLLVRM